MTSELRSRRKPCLRSPRGTLLAVVGAVALVAAAPAAAAEPEFLKPLGWYSEEGAVPTTVEFHDVAAAGDVVVAVGTDTGQPVIYSRIGGTWQQAAVDPLPPGSLDDVVFDGATGWAVGTADGQAPLVLELDNGVWTDRSALAGLAGAPRAIALNGTGAIIGDDAGSLRRLSAGGAPASESQEATSAGAINGLSPGIAVADYDRDDALAGKGARIYELRDQPMLEANEQTRDPGVDMKGLAASAANHAVAFDSTNATWRLTVAFGQNDWIRESAVPNASGLADVASVQGGAAPYNTTGYGTEFLAGREGDTGALWHRTRLTKDPAAWNRDAVPAGTPALNGVAATAWDAAWAVGSGGTILRYHRPPDPDAEAAWRAQQQQQQQQEQQQQQQQTGTSTTGGSLEQTGPQQTSIVTLGEWQPSGSSTGESSGDRLVTNGVVIEDGDDTPTPVRKRLVKNVRAIFTRTRSGRRRLIVTFRLTRRAQVSVAAKRGRRLIGRTRPQTLRKGRRRVVLPVRGKQPPTSLKLIARPVRRAT